MNKRKVFSILSISCFVVFLLGLAVMLFTPVATAAYDSEQAKQLTHEGNSIQITTALTATNEISDTSNHVVAVVIQPGQNQIHAFSALTGEWATLDGSSVRVRADDTVIASKLVVLVAQPGQNQIHAYSALTGEWATLAGTDVRVAPDDMVKVNDSVIVVAQPGQNQLHAFSAFTGEWATLAGIGVRVAPDDKILVGTE